jgi:hypothetical protein
MKKSLLIGAMALVTSSLIAAEKDDVAAAAKKLAEQPNYSWNTKTVVPEGTQFRPGPTEGKTIKGGVTFFTTSFGDNVSQTYVQGDKGALTNRDGAWQSLAEVENQEGFARFRAGQARAFKAPAVQAEELALGTTAMKKDGDAFGGTLTEEAAKNVMRFRFGGNDGPTITGAKGSAKFWLKDGVLTKFEYSVKGAMEFNGNNFDLDRVTTVEIKDVGTTKIDVPSEAKKKMQ